MFLAASPASKSGLLSDHTDPVDDRLRRQLVQHRDIPASELIRRHPQASLATAVEIECLISNPAKRAGTTTSLRPKSIFLSYLEVDRLVGAAMALKRQHSDATTVELLALSCLRASEVVPLQVQDVDVKSRGIKVRRTMTIDITGAPVVGEPKQAE